MSSDTKVEKVPTAKEVKAMHKNIGIKITPPSEVCKDKNCPFHGDLRVRGFTLVGKITSSKMKNTVVISREKLYYLKKYERYEKRSSKIHAHLPPCVDVGVGDNVRIMECRPVAKSVSYVVVGQVN